ncbi:MAG TPA: hypothetical protein VFP72_14590 [Kineosporiaceae bacterium]|nr:hypothetical protein [Kineosporiaceae bacterium]
MNSASFVFLAALAVAALLGLLARTWSHDRARYRAMVAHERTGQTQAGWDPRFAWGATPEPVGQAGSPAAPVTVTATVTGPQPPKWWERPGAPQASRPGKAAPQSPSPTPSPVTSGPQLPATRDRVVVDGQPATVTGQERVGRATRVHLRRDDGQLGFVDIPDIDTAVPVAPSSSPTARGASAPAEQEPPAPVPAVPAPAPQPAVRPPVRPGTAPVAHPATTPTRQAPPAASVTLGGITVSLGDPAPTSARPAPQDLSPAEQRRRHLAAHGYTGPTDADGFPLFGSPDMATRAAG